MEPVVVCVLRNGGDYTVNYVARLKCMVQRNTTVPYEFVCLTDVPIVSYLCKTIALESTLKGWWAKLELFRTGLFKTDRIVYFDLDTVIVGNIDDLLETKLRFAALGDWNPGPQRDSIDKFGSGLMTWKNSSIDYSFLYKDFNPSRDIQRRTGTTWNIGDQAYIARSLQSHMIKPAVIQDHISGIYSYKRNGCAQGLPSDARVICFHGRPRPHQALNVEWVRDNWR